MAYTRDAAIEFWFQFDKTFLPPASPAVLAIYQVLFPGGNLNSLHTGFRVKASQAGFPGTWTPLLTPKAAALADLANRQVAIFDQFWQGDRMDEESAFVDFGQGVLFDNRRQAGLKLHKMDGAGTTLIGYSRWYAFARAVSLTTPGLEPRWLGLARNVGLAWQIQFEAAPVEDSETNAGLAPARLLTLRAHWSSLPWAQLDAKFLSFPTPPTV